ncbi:MAG: hypothetical protein PHO08_19470 [Methylococcales bacterium]|nr:hypothetical protein [Methylococcales bacterium]MDD5630990.1 hypothetical protein [Methylococcales bacterium]
MNSSTMIKTSLLSKNMYEVFIKQAAEKISEVRRLMVLGSHYEYYIHHINDIGSSDEDKKADWERAVTFLGSCVLYEDNVQFNQLDPECYQHLELTWLDEIKKLTAYFIWLGVSQTSHVDNYLEACNKVNYLLLNREPQPSQLFSDAHTYINEKYLTTEGFFDEKKKKAISEIEARSHRGWEINNSLSPIDNWLNAKNYLKVFYENIIPAIEDKSKIHISNIIRAVYDDKKSADPYRIVSCFEVILMINFLDKKIVREVLNELNISYPI